MARVCVHRRSSTFTGGTFRSRSRADLECAGRVPTVSGRRRRFGSSIGKKSKAVSPLRSASALRILARFAGSLIVRDSILGLAPLGRTREGLLRPDWEYPPRLLFGIIGAL